MRIYLLRHGIAVDPGTKGCRSDAERTLTPEGRQKLLHSAAAFKALQISPDLVLSSPYVRARQTAKLIARQLGLGRKQLLLTEHLQPGGSFKSLIREIGQIRTSPASLLLVGHEPDLSLVASHLVAGSAKMRVELKKSGLIALDAPSLGPGDAVLLAALAAMGRGPVCSLSRAIQCGSHARSLKDSKDRILAASRLIETDAAGYRLHWVKGSYFALPGSMRSLVRRLVYPVPHAESLGVHVVVSLDGGVKFGPDVEYLDDRRKDYTVDEGRRAAFAEAARHILPSLRDEDLRPDMAGIRPKLQREGDPPRDFLIQEESARGLPGFVNLIGIESPGLTASPAIARLVARILRA